ncbi:hypothetical protein ABZ894_00745 [Nocardia beijingensis]|uniref:hypothetical protein n=1 Tax=Nocardia beijingensis TaxID=95162 RepID=UPI0034043C8F
MPHSFARDLVTGSRRQRLLFGVTVVVADRGYLTATVANIASAGSPDLAWRRDLLALEDTVMYIHRALLGPATSAD